MSLQKPWYQTFGVRQTHQRLPIESMTRRKIAKLECNLPSLLLAVSLSRAAHFPLPSVRISDRHYRYVANIAAYV